MVWLSVSHTRAVGSPRFWRSFFLGVEGPRAGGAANRGVRPHAFHDAGFSGPVPVRIAEQASRVPPAGPFRPTPGTATLRAIAPRKSPFRSTEPNQPFSLSRTHSQWTRTTGPDRGIRRSPPRSGWCWRSPRRDGSSTSTKVSSSRSSRPPRSRNCSGATRAAVSWHGNIAFALFLVGGAVGGLGFGVLRHRIGRVRVMSWTILVYSLFSALTFFARTVWEVEALRFLVGARDGGRVGGGGGPGGGDVPDQGAGVRVGDVSCVERPRRRARLADGNGPGRARRLAMGVPARALAGLAGPLGPLGFERARALAARPRRGGRRAPRAREHDRAAGRPALAAARAAGARAGVGRPGDVLGDLRMGAGAGGRGARHGRFAGTQTVGGEPGVPFDELHGGAVRPARLRPPGRAGGVGGSPSWCIISGPWWSCR